MQPFLIVSFEHYNEVEFLQRVEAIAPAVDPNANFPGPWPAPLMQPSWVTTTVAAYKAAYLAAAGGDKAKIKVRVAQRVALTKQLKPIAHYFEIVAAGDVSLLATTGYELRHDIVKSAAPEPVGALEDFKVTRAALSGGLIVHAKADPNADTYQVQIASADPSVAANWSAAGEFVHCNKIELMNLTPTKVYYVRMAGFNKAGLGVWTTSPGITVV